MSAHRHWPHGASQVFPATHSAPARSVLRRRRGVTSLEFATGAGAFMLMLLASMEASLQLATGMALEWSAGRASRFGITGAAAPPGVASGATPGCRSAVIPWLVGHATAGFLRDASLTVETESFPDMAQAQAGTPGIAGPGSGGEVVRYRFAYRRPFVTPVAIALTGRAEFVHRVELLVQNEPFRNATC